jgi:undecaprenyl diphosphate synthase
MHVAIIMDGNGRWALRRGLPRSAGHRAGAKAVDRVVEAAARGGIGTLTLLAFSSDNWHRPVAEVDALMTLFLRYLFTQTSRCLEQFVRINVIGRRDRLNADLRRAIERSELATAQCNGMHLRIAVDYSSQRSLMAVRGNTGDEQIVGRARFLELLAAVDHSSPPAPAVDLLIRTGGERRLSDFLLWECAYAELHFIDSLWPDFGQRGFDDALEQYARRERRFGRISTMADAEPHHG